MHAKSLQLCPTFCHPMDYSPPGSSVHGDFMPSPKGSSRPRDRTHVTCGFCTAGKFFTIEQYFFTREAQFQAYNRLIWCFYTLWMITSLYKIVTISLTIFSVITSLWHIFCSWSWYLLILITLLLSMSPAYFLLSKPPLCSLCPWICFSFVSCFRFHIEVKACGICFSLSDLFY